MKIKWVVVILFTLTTSIMHAQKTDSTDYNNFKWEFGYSLPTTFGKQVTIGSDLILKKPFIDKNGKQKAYRYGLYFSNRNYKILNSTANYQSTNFFVMPHFGIEKRKYVSRKLYFINGFQTGFDISISKTKLAQASTIENKNNQYSLFGDYFIGLKYHLNRNISITSESSASILYTSLKNYPTNQDNINHNLELIFNPLRRLYISYNF